jgi:hypothetical protein
MQACKVIVEQSYEAWLRILKQRPVVMELFDLHPFSILHVKSQFRMFGLLLYCLFLQWQAVLFLVLGLVQIYHQGFRFWYSCKCFEGCMY